MRNAKIVCTLGPASDDSAVIEDLADAGMSVARLNASHGTTAHREDVIERVRAVDDTIEDPLAVMVDLKGPEVRTAEIDDPIVLTDGSTVMLEAGDDATPERVGLSHSIADADAGDTVLLDDGRIECRVESTEDESVHTTVVSGGELGSRKGVNLPGVDIDVDLITEEDEAELRLAARANADFVAASFVRDGADVYRIADTLEEYGGDDIPVIAKIERAGAVENLDEIVDAADGVMVARGDLGVECPLEDVPIIQKRIIRTCVEAGVPVITATEMLDSMVHSPRPTRAEASDVANAVLDGTDAVMLSGETAIGDHPARVVETMDRIIRDVEGSEEYAESREQRVPNAGDTRTDALARSGRFLARDIGASAIVAASESGYTALKSAKYRPSIPIVASTPSERVRRKLALSWGIRPVTTEYTTEGADAVIQTAVQAALDTEAADSGDTVVVLSGMMTELDGMNTANMLKVHVAAETVASGRPIVDGLVTGPVHRISTAPPRESPGDLSNVPEGAILAVPEGFDGEFVGDTSRIGGIIDGHEGVTSYAAIVARELSIPMISNADLPDAVSDESTVTLDSERGVVYEESVGREDISGRERDY